MIYFHMKMSWGLLILCLVAFCVEEQESINVVNKLGFPPPNCTLADNVTREVYRGWTFKVDCELLEAEVEDYDDFTCAIMDMDRKSVLRNNTAYFDEALFTAYENYDARDDSPLNFFVQATVPGIPFCAYAEVHINLTNAPQHTCQESFTVWVNSTINVGEPLDLSCTAPALQPSVLSPIPSNMTGTWLKNCSSFSSNATVILPGNAAVVNKLRFPSFSYDDVGVYTCRVSYNNRARYVIHFSTCAKPPNSLITAPSTQCTHNALEVVKGEDIKLECLSDLGAGRRSTSTRITVRWTQNKGNNLTEGTLCFNSVEGTNPSSNTPKVSCFYKLEKTCFSHIATPEERKLGREIITLHLLIPNVQDSDLGTYTIEVDTTNGNSNSSVIVFEKSQNGWIVGVAVGLAVLVMLLLISVLCFVFRLYIFVVIKRVSKNYTTEQKEYGAYLSYQFSSDMDTFSQQQTREAAAFTRNALDCLGYKIFEEQRDGQSNGYIAESSIESMAKCHRVVIILTSEYIKDSWNVYRLQTGFLNMIESGSKMIFILVPGTKEFIKKKAVEDECCKMVYRALKLNHAIKWSNGKKFNEKRFKFQLELAMPNINPHATNLPPGMANGNGRANGYHRGISTATDVTELNSPRYLSDIDEVYFPSVDENGREDAKV